MKKLPLALLLASVAFSPVALAQTADAPANANAPAATTAGESEIEGFRVLIVRANEQLERRERTAASQTLTEADQNLQTQAESNPEYDRFDEQLQSARQAVDEDRLTEARRILVVMLEDEELVETADATARLRVAVPEPDVTVQQSDPEVTVQQASPQVEVDPGRPQVTVNQAAPQVRVQMPQPTITIDMPRPQIIVEMPDPDVSVGMAQPRVTVNQADPTVTVDQGTPQIAVGGAEATTEDGETAERADVTVEEGQANVAVQPSRAVVNVAETEPQVRYNTADPEIQIESAGDPIVDFNQSGESDVQIRQMGEQAGAERAANAEENDTDNAAAQQDAAARPAANRDSDNEAVNAASASEVELQVGQLDDYSVIGANANDLGSIEKFVNVDGRIYAVVASGGFFGLGANETAIPLSSLVLTNDQLVAPNITESQVDSLQDFDGDAYPELPQDHVITIGRG